MAYIDASGKVAVWILSSVIAVAFGVYALWVSWRRKKTQEGQVEFFLTARNTQPTLRVAWSYVAGAMGSWLISLPANNAAGSGIIGLITYSIFAGLPLFLIALVGNKIQVRLPSVLGFGDYVRYRFGFLPQLYVALIMLFNIGLALAAEYTTIATIFTVVLGSSGIPIVLLIGAVTTVYTAAGGLLVSILTDQYQAIFGSSLIIVLVIYLSSTFSLEGLGPLPESLALTDSGYKSIITMPISLICATVFSEAPWQRIWASENSIALKRGALLGSSIVSIIVFIFGVFGILSAWAGHDPSNLNDSVIWLLASAKGSESLATQCISGLVLILSVVMCESAVDTFQNALTSTVSTILLKDQDIKWSRLAVILLNIPPMVISLQNYDTFQLFMIGNKVASTSAIPMILGLYRPVERYLTGPAALFGCFFSLISVIIYGCLAIESFSVEGISYGLSDPYDPYSFIVAVASSTVGVSIWCLTSLGLGKLGFVGWNIPGFRPQYNESNNQDPCFDEKISSHNN